MAKVLIINDQLNIAKSMQRHLGEINDGLFQDENVFCLSRGSNCEITPIASSLETAPMKHIDHKTIREITGAILRFLEDNKGEYILILIDGDLVETNNIFDDIDCTKDLSAFLYAVLLMFKNGKSSIDGNEYKISRKNFAFFLFSDGEYSFSRITSSLKKIHESLSENAKSFFPIEATKPENISFVRGGGKCYMDYLIGNGVISGDDYARLQLSDSYGEFIKNL